MRTFVLRARVGPTSPERVETGFGRPYHVEVITQSIVSALFISKDLRQDVVFHVVLEGAPDPPKIVSLDSSSLFHLEGFDDREIAAVLRRALEGGRNLVREETRQVDSGLTVSRTSFEHLVRDVGERTPLYLLSKRGTDLRQVELSDDCCFLLTDHIPMQRKTLHLLKRLSVTRVSLGPTMLFAAHCIVLVHNELDRRGVG
jgi:tRNA (pseudouridine54-N1)-methyltransferase